MGELCAPLSKALPSDSIPGNKHTQVKRHLSKLIQKQPLSALHRLFDTHSKVYEQSV